MKKNKGFTLIELVIVIAIVGIISVIIGSMLLGVIDAWTFKFNRNDLLWDGRLAINRMTREIRTADSITTATSGQLRFMDTENSGATWSTVHNDITYSLSSTNLNRNGILLAENVSSLTFTYYNASGAELPTPTVPANIKRVRMNLTLTKNGENVYLRSDASTKNF